MIEIIKEKKKKKEKTPYYILKYNYMIGDGNGYTNYKVDVSKDNPYIERYVKLLNSLTPVKGRWGVVLENRMLEACVKENQITEDDYRFLLSLMFEDCQEEEDNDDEKEQSLKADDEYITEFFDGVRSDTEYSFLVFQGIELIYVDEFGVKHKTKIV